MDSDYRKVVAITGSSAGIGRDLAILFAKRGYKVGLLARRIELLEQVREEIVSKNGVASIVECDVADKEVVKAAIKKIEADLGCIDIFIANAGVKNGMNSSNFHAGEASNVFKVNVFGILNCIDAVLPGMLNRRRGHIVGISSVGAYFSVPQDPVYCASKAALSSLLEGMRIDLLPKNILVSTICPGFVKTEMIANDKNPQPCMIESDKAARLIFKAIEKKKKVYNFPIRLYLLTVILRCMPTRMASKILNAL